MKIAFLLTQSLDSPSGIGRYGPMARELSRMGHEINIYALHPDFASLTKHKFTQNGVNIQYLSPMHVKKHGNVKTYYSSIQLFWVTFRATWRLILAALNSRSDIIYVCKPHPMNGIAGLIARYILPKHLFVDCDDYEAGSSHFSGEWQKRGVAFFERTIPKYADLVTTNTYFMRDKLVGWGIPAEKVVYIPNGVELDRFRPPNPNEIDALRKELGVEGKKVVAYIGSLSLPSHPIDLLIDAFSEVHASIPDSVLILVGGGEDYEIIKEKVRHLGVEPAVRFCGRVPPEDVVRYYHISQVSVDPVRDDDAARGRSPLKLFESWAAGVPVVTADVGDRRSLLGSPPAGMLADPGNPDLLTACILKILRDSQFSEELRLRGSERSKMYSWETLARQLESTYKQILS